jgi:hypothetical protein
MPISILSPTRTAAGLEDLVPGQAELAPVDAGAGAEGGAILAPRVLGEAQELGVEHDLARSCP